MNKVKTLVSRRFLIISMITTFILVNILSINCFAADAPEDQWNNFSAACLKVENFWHNNFGYIPLLDPEVICAGYYGKHVSSKSQVTNPVDFIARTIYGEVIDVTLRINNAFAVAQTIQNRIKRNYATTAKSACENVSWYEATGKRCWLWPSHRDYNTELFEPQLSQEELFVHCLFLAKLLHDGEPIPTRHVKWNFPVVTEIGLRIHFFHVSAGDCPFYLSNGLQCTPSNVTSAARFRSHPLTLNVISGGGNHVYFDYDRIY